MSERPVDVDLTQGTATRLDTAMEEDILKNLLEKPSPEEMKDYEHRVAQVLERGMVIDRLKVDVPDELESRWEAADAVSIASAELRGFVIDTHYAKKNSLTDGGDGKARIGDVVHMVRPKWKKDIEDKVKARQYHENHIADKRNRQKEERQFLAQNELQPIEGSKVTEVSGAQIEETLSPSRT